MKHQEWSTDHELGSVSPGISHLHTAEARGRWAALGAQYGAVRRCPAAVGSPRVYQGPGVGSAEPGTAMSRRGFKSIIFQHEEDMKKMHYAALIRGK